jgi:hypothetical protein
MENNFLWSEDDVEVSEDGFLFFKHSKEEKLDDEDQPLLLHTTARLLRALYPSLSMGEIVLHSGYSGEEEEPTTIQCLDDEKRSIQSSGDKEKNENSQLDDNDDDEKRTIQSTDDKEKNENSRLDDSDDDNNNDDDDERKTPIQIEYRSYQNLVREENLSNTIISALLDIRNFRHRINNSQSYTSSEEIKVRALHHQQQRLLQVKNGSGISNENNETDTTTEESITIKLVRTTNSIRALFPHLLPILNHPRRNDKDLVIGKFRYKTKRNGAMCWLLGTMSFNTTTCKQCIAAYDDVTRILESFIDTRVAKDISKDSKGSPTFWTSSWIEHIIKRSKPSLPSPLKILSVSSGKSEKEIEQMARICDTKIYSLKQATGEGTDQQYQKAVTKIHNRLSNVLTSRFKGARVSKIMIPELFLAILTFE